MLTQTLDKVAQQMGRGLTSLEESIVKLLNEKCTNRLNHRFTVDNENNLLACETDGRAGILELAEDYACAFKTEPVYAESVQGIAEKLAIASGKIYREMSVSGSQPLATLLSLSAGKPANAQAQANLQRAVASMASYGNTFGIPVVGGNVRFKDSEFEDISADIFTIGLIDKDSWHVPSVQGSGNPVFLVGAPEFGNKNYSSAFTTRSIYELICDLHDDGAILSIQNVDHGGIAIACADMIANGENGIELNAALFDDEHKLTEIIHDKVVIILKKEFSKKLEKTCRKWNMRCIQVGVVIDEHKLSIVKDQTSAASLPMSVLNLFYGDIPERNNELPPTKLSTSETDVPIPGEHKEVAKFLMTSPNLISQQWIFEQFDSTVGTNNLSTNFFSDAPVLQIKGARHGLAVSFSQSAVNIAKYPEAVNLSVAEALHRVVCSGGVPCAITGCLNYSGDMDEKILQSINNHIALLCKKTGVSSSGIHIKRIASEGKPEIKNLSTAAIAFLNDKHQQMTFAFKGKGDMIYMLGKSGNSLDSSEYIRYFHDIKDSPPQYIDLNLEAKLLQVAQKLIARKLVKSAHHVSKGGLFMSLLESAMVRSFGFDITVDAEIRKDAFLFGESPSRIIVSVAMARETDFIDFMIDSHLPFLTLGHVTREEIRIDDNSYGFISDYQKRYFVQ